MQFDHRYWMSQALELAKKIKHDVPIAALIVKDNVLISTGINEIEILKDATAHAEILAIREASTKLSDWRLNDCVLYTTLEPCAMCAGAIVNSRISKMIFGAYDINAGACGSKVNLFNDLDRESYIEILGGIMEMEASKLLKEFFALKR